MIPYDNGIESRQMFPERTQHLLPLELLVFHLTYFLLNSLKSYPWLLTFLPTSKCPLPNRDLKFYLQALEALNPLGSVTWIISNLALFMNMEPLEQEAIIERICQRVLHQTKARSANRQSPAQTSTKPCDLSPFTYPIGAKGALPTPLSLASTCLLLAQLHDGTPLGQSSLASSVLAQKKDVWPNPYLLIDLIRRLLFPSQDSTLYSSVSTVTSTALALAIAFSSTMSQAEGLYYITLKNRYKQERHASNMIIKILILLLESWNL